MDASVFSDIAGRILFEDNHLLVVNKRMGELSQGDKTGDPSLVDTLKDFIKQRDEKPGNVFLGLVHRLDRPTSGILVFAKTSKALSRLNAIFHDRTVRKWYWAIVDQAPPQEEGDLVHFLLRTEKENKSRAFDEAGPNRQEARLHYRIAGRTDRYVLLELEIKTGRHHQIRAQLQAIGVHIKGDLKYGAKRSNPDGGISLHAARIELPHPVQESTLSLLADPCAVQHDKLWSLFPQDGATAGAALDLARRAEP